MNGSLAAPCCCCAAPAGKAAGAFANGPDPLGLSYAAQAVGVVPLMASKVHGRAAGVACPRRSCCACNLGWRALCPALSSHKLPASLCRSLRKPAGGAARCCSWASRSIHCCWRLTQAWCAPWAECVGRAKCHHAPCRSVLPSGSAPLPWGCEALSPTKPQATRWRRAAAPTACFRHRAPMSRPPAS
jgi:hypothetical protein